MCDFYYIRVMFLLDLLLNTAHLWQKITCRPDLLLLFQQCFMVYYTLLHLLFNPLFYRDIINTFFFDKPIMLLEILCTEIDCIFSAFLRCLCVVEQHCVFVELCVCVVDGETQTQRRRAVHPRRWSAAQPAAHGGQWTTIW
ncbi:unnamed protein product [Boreogadus saida]